MYLLVYVLQNKVVDGMRVLDYHLVMTWTHTSMTLSFN